MNKRVAIEGGARGEAIRPPIEAPQGPESGSS